MILFQNNLNQMKHNYSNEHKVVSFRQDEGNASIYDIGTFFSSMKSAVLFVVIVSIYMLIILLGAYIGQVRLHNGVKESQASIDTAVAAVLGLLAFLLGFTFSFAWTRFANRNRLVIEHAEAISICYLRASLIPEKQQQEARRLLKEYTSIIQNIQTTSELDHSLAKITKIHALLWIQTTELVNEEMDSELRSLFIASVNDLITLAAKRKVVALFIRLPNAIWITLFCLATLGLLAFGYQAGMSGVSRSFQLLLLPVAFGLVIVLIADLNSQEAKRHFKVTQHPIKEVLEIIEKTSPQ
jgi:predicted nucleic acid-binding protein